MATTHQNTPAQRKVNVRTPEVMARVQAEVETHYRSSVVERIRAAGGILSIGNTTIRLAKQFGFCYGVERAIDLAFGGFAGNDRGAGAAYLNCNDSGAVR